VVARAGLIIVAVGIGVAWILGALNFLGVGLSELPPRSDDIAQRIVDNFLADEASYLLWFRWVDLAIAIAFAALLLVIPSLRHAHRASVAMTAGVIIMVVADMIDLSKLIAIETGRLALDNDLAADFAAANMARFMLDWTSTYVWVAGLLILGVGLAVLAADAGPGRWRMVTAVLAFTLAAVAITDVFRPLRDVFDVAFTAMTVALIAWTLVARRHLDDDVAQAT
jgi:hypothetical protein